MRIPYKFFVNFQNKRLVNAYMKRRLDENKKKAKYFITMYVHTRMISSKQQNSWYYTEIYINISRGYCFQFCLSILKAARHTNSERMNVQSHARQKTKNKLLARIQHSLFRWHFIFGISDTRISFLIWERWWFRLLSICIGARATWVHRKQADNRIKYKE